MQRQRSGASSDASGDSAEVRRSRRRGDGRRREAREARADGHAAGPPEERVTCATHAKRRGRPTATADPRDFDYSARVRFARRDLTEVHPCPRSSSRRSRSARSRSATGSSSPMCQYSATDGVANDWHLVHLNGATGGAGTLLVERRRSCPRAASRTAISGSGTTRRSSRSRASRASPSRRAAPGIQLAHAGAKASTSTPWQGRARSRSPTVAGCRSARAPRRSRTTTPRRRRSTEAGIARVIGAFRDAAKRSLAASSVRRGACGARLPAARFSSPLVNKLHRRLGGSFENACADARGHARCAPYGRTRLPVWCACPRPTGPKAAGTLDQTVRLAGLLREVGADLIDCSSGAVPWRRSPSAPATGAVRGARAPRSADRDSAVG